MSKCIAVRWIATLALCLIAVGPTAHAASEKVPPTDARAIEQVLRDQLAAFARDDAKRAFAHAAPDIQRLFGNSDEFLRMVRDAYAPVYRASSIYFVKLEAIGGSVFQTVQLADSEGRVWLARFTMRRQPDKSWKVGGCELARTRSLAT